LRGKCGPGENRVTDLRGNSIFHAAHTSPHALSHTGGACPARAWTTHPASRSCVVAGGRDAATVVRAPNQVSQEGARMDYTEREREQRLEDVLTRSVKASLDRLMNEPRAPRTGSACPECEDGRV